MGQDGGGGRGGAEGVLASLPDDTVKNDDGDDSMILNQTYFSSTRLANSKRLTMFN